MIAFKVNGQEQQVEVDPSTPLLWVIREQLKLTGTKFGCGMAQCGACTVQLNGTAIRSCTTPVAAAAGQDITTIEGLAPSEEEERQLVQKVLVGEQAMLFLPDLIAHKGYQQRREYRQGNIKTRYEAAADSLFRETTSLLAQKESQQRPSLDALAQQYETFLAVVPQLETLRLSLARQLYNIEQFEGRTAFGEILTYHHHYLRATRQELNLLIAKGKTTRPVNIA